MTGPDRSIRSTTHPDRIAGRPLQPTRGDVHDSIANGARTSASPEPAGDLPLITLTALLRDVEDVELRPILDPSTAHALQDMAVQEDAGVIVIGSSHTGRFGRLMHRSIAERLLHAAPCPVAVVPDGYRARATTAHLVIGCADRPTTDGDASLDAAEELALALSVSLRIMHVVEPMPTILDTGETPLDVPAINASIRTGAQEALSRRLSRLDPRIDAEGTLYEGEPAEVLIELSETVDILVVGSRGFGPLTAVLLGGVSSRVVRGAACPVVVAPRPLRRRGHEGRPRVWSAHVNGKAVAPPARRTAEMQHSTTEDRSRAEPTTDGPPERPTKAPRSECAPTAADDAAQGCLARERWVNEGGSIA